jgi:formate/nitrite transporter FocA (FNT family)
MLAALDASKEKRRTTIMRNIIAGIVAGAVIAAALSFNTSAQSDTERQMKDRVEIEALREVAHQNA